MINILLNLKKLLAISFKIRSGRIDFDNIIDIYIKDNHITFTIKKYSDHFAENCVQYHASRMKKGTITFNDDEGRLFSIFSWNQTKNRI